jgi:hypothetical protein
VVFHRSRTIFVRAPNPNITIRDFFIAVRMSGFAAAGFAATGFNSKAIGFGI